MRQPRDYSGLRTAHANAPEPPATPQKSPAAPQPGAQAEPPPEPTRPAQVRDWSPAWPDSARMDVQQPAATSFNARANAHLAEQRAAATHGGRDTLRADMQKATGHEAQQGRLEEPSPAAAMTGREALRADMRKAAEAVAAPQQAEPSAGRDR